MSITKTVFCFVFSEIKNQFFFFSLTPCLLLRGLNLSVVNYQNHGKTQEKVNLTLCYGHYITDITLWTSHHTLYYGHYDCMTFNGNSFGRNKCYMHTNFVQIYQFQVCSAFE